jgi:transcriptional regulator with GAF, ATPase, and Fis domain
VIARAVHQRSDRRDGPFIRVNCGAIPRELIDSQLFGHEKGAFTGASELRRGWFERADGGTLFLDEIGELPPEAQVRFLRVLQDSFIERVGGGDPLRVDVRVIAATHRDLAGMVQSGTFREDLWYRIAVFPILLPPLRDRLDDIQSLAEHFAERAAHRFGLSRVLPTAADIELLRAYEWPGNIRELGAVIDRAAILGDGRTLEVKAALGFSGTASLARLTPSRATVDQVLPLDAAMRQHIEQALVATQGRIDGRGGAAELLQINPHTLRSRMKKLQLDWRAFRVLPP